MIRKIFITGILFFNFTAFTFALNYSNYQNNYYNYEIIIPKDWPKEEVTSSNNHLMSASKDANAEIKVRAFKSSDKDVEKTTHEKIWDLRKIDPGLNKIIETENITIKKNISGKFLIFEYTSKKNKFLHRTLITRNSGIIYIIECRAPNDTFYKYEDIFTTAMASFKYLNANLEITEPVPEMETQKNEKITNEDNTEESLEEEPVEVPEDEQI